MACRVTRTAANGLQSDAAQDEPTNIAAPPATSGQTVDDSRRKRPPSAEPSLPYHALSYSGRASAPLMLRPRPSHGLRLALLRSRDLCRQKRRLYRAFIVLHFPVHSCVRVLGGTFLYAVPRVAITVCTDYGYPAKDLKLFLVYRINTTFLIHSGPPTRDRLYIINRLVLKSKYPSSHFHRTRKAPLLPKETDQIEVLECGRVACILFC